MRILLPLPVFLFMAIPVFSQFVFDPFSLNAAELEANKKAGVHFIHKYLQPEEWEGEPYEEMFFAGAEYSESGLPVLYFEQEEFYDDDADWDTVYTVYYLFSGPGNRLSRARSIDSEEYEVVTVFSYDSKGNLRKKEVADIDPPTYEYGYEKGRITSCKVTQQFPDYDEDGNFTGKAVSVHTYQHIYSYDKSGRVSEEIQYQVSEGFRNFAQRTVFEYDNEGRLVRISTYYDEEGGDPGMETIYSYDSKGLLTKLTERDLYMEIEMNYEFRYTFY